MAGLIDLSDDNIADLIHRIKGYVFPRRIRMREFFVDADPLKSGRCTYSNFHRAMDRAGIGLTDEEITALAEHFTQYGPKVEKPAIFDYKKFCAVIDEVFAVEGPGPQVSSSPSSTQMMTFQYEDDSAIMHLLHRFACLCKTRGILVKYLYTDLDRAPIASPSMQNNRRGGKVTKGQFIRLFPFKREFSEQDIDAIAECYKTESGDVHFMALHNDVTEFMEHGAQPFPESPLYLKPDDTEWSHQQMHAVDKIRSKVVEKRIRLQEHFQDFDPLRKGFCTVGQVKTVFTIVNLDKCVDKVAFEEIAAHYSRDDGLFCYRDFCIDVDSAFTTPGLEASPLATISMPDASDTAPARRNTMTISNGGRGAVARIEDMIRTKVRTKERILLKPQFTMFDRTNRGFVTRNQFVRVMNNMGFNLTDTEVGLLCSVYCNLGNHTDFNYVDFNRTVDPPDEDEAIAMQQLSAPYQEKLPMKYFDERGRIIPASP